jgi:hypothetical protein
MEHLPRVSDICARTLMPIAGIEERLHLLEELGLEIRFLRTVYRDVPRTVTVSH